MNNNNSFVNRGFCDDSPSIPGGYNKTNNGLPKLYTIENTIVTRNKIEPPKEILDVQNSHNKQINNDDRGKWGKDIEFLMSCIALSVGLGNVWRFPFTALKNGGGAFVIPYIIVLFLVGKPVYYMEMLLGQFSSRGSVKVYDFAPIMRGVGYGQVLSTGVVTTYYATLMALTIRYFFASFSSVLPWSYCQESWGDTCIESANINFTYLNTSVSDVMKTPAKTSAELYFINVILKEKSTIHDGIGYPSWSLALCLAFSWIIVSLILIKGVRSSGKASYFLAIFPYFVMFILLIRALTLPGAFNGVLYFIKPQWDKLLDPKVWYAAVTQVFFSLAICFGNIIMYASYNRFGHNIYKDALIITSLDTITSMLAGIIIFGILGNLAFESNVSDIKTVVQGDTGLAFISYPEAIAKFKFIPQIFAMLFFIMLFVLGIGSNVAMASCIMTVIKDRFSNLKHWIIVVMIAVVGFLIGLIYLTPGGQYILLLVDFYGASFVAFVLAIAELIAVGWIYGVKRLCRDIEFMLGIKTGWYWRICWGIITPLLMSVILIYSIIDLRPLTYKDYVYPDTAYNIGWSLSAFCILQLFLGAFLAIRKQPSTLSLWQRIRQSFKPTANWGPADPVLLEDYKIFISNKTEQLFRRNEFWYRIYDNIFG